MSNKNIKYLNLAGQIASQNDRKKHYNLACLIQRSDGSFAFAKNAKVRIPEPSLHAEARALRKGGKGGVIWITRVLANGEWANASPCNNCRKLIKKYKIKLVIYSLNKNEYGVWRP